MKIKLKDAQFGRLYWHEANTEEFQKIQRWSNTERQEAGSIFETFHA